MADEAAIGRRRLGTIMTGATHRVRRVGGSRGFALRAGGCGGPILMVRADLVGGVVVMGGMGLGGCGKAGQNQDDKQDQPGQKAVRTLAPFGSVSRRRHDPAFGSWIDDPDFGGSHAAIQDIPINTSRGMAGRLLRMVDHGDPPCPLRAARRAWASLAPRSGGIGIG